MTDLKHSENKTLIKTASRAHHDCVGTNNKLINIFVNVSSEILKFFVDSIFPRFDTCPEFISLLKSCVEIHDLLREYHPFSLPHLKFLSKDRLEHVSYICVSGRYLVPLNNSARKPTIEYISYDLVETILYEL